MIYTTTPGLIFQKKLIKKLDTHCEKIPGCKPVLH